MEGGGKEDGKCTNMPKAFAVTADHSRHGLARRLVGEIGEEGFGTTIRVERTVRVWVCEGADPPSSHSAKGVWGAL